MRLLHILSQRPGLSGSGVFFNSMVRETHLKGIRQYAVVAGPLSTTYQDVLRIDPESFSLIPFPSREAPFPVPGNSDVMPYPSTVFSQMGQEQVEQYLGTSRDVLESVRKEFRPDLVHSHHLWLMTSLARRVFHDVPVVATAHNSELRQLVKAGHLKSHVLGGIRALDRVFALTPQSKVDTIAAFGVSPDNVVVTGAGFREDLFSFSDCPREQIAARLERKFQIVLPGRTCGLKMPRFVTFAGRLSSPKGVPYLIEAFLSFRKKEVEDVRLLLVGASGFGEDGKRLDEVVEQAGPNVVHLGAMPQAAVALVFQCSDVFVLPSLFEGLPLVMMEAAACGCPCLASGLPTIRSWVPGKWVEDGHFSFIPPLQTTQADRPVESDVGRFTDDIEKRLSKQLSSVPLPDERRQLAALLRDHSWAAVFDRYQETYRRLL